LRTFPRLECGGSLLQSSSLVAMGRIFYIGPLAAPGCWTDGHGPNALRRYRSDHPSKSSRGPDNASNVVGGPVSVSFVLVYGRAMLDCPRRGKDSGACAFFETAKRR
jgi:hypothetical protein